MLIRIIAIRLEIHPPNGTTTGTQLHTHTHRLTIVSLLVAGIWSGAVDLACEPL